MYTCTQTVYNLSQQHVLHVQDVPVHHVHDHDVRHPLLVTGLTMFAQSPEISIAMFVNKPPQICNRTQLHTYLG